MVDGNQVLAQQEELDRQISHVRPLSFCHPFHFLILHATNHQSDVSILMKLQAEGLLKGYLAELDGAGAEKFVTTMSDAVKVLESDQMKDHVDVAELGALAQALLTIRNDVQSQIDKCKRDIKEYQRQREDLLAQMRNVGYELVAAVICRPMRIPLSSPATSSFLLARENCSACLNSPCLCLPLSLYI
jgi:hypothetical protein